jgi:APA family basic amino acid/polyamine antiporter
MLKEMMKTKPIGKLVSDAHEGEHRLKRALSALDLTAIGIGCIIGTGIFVLTGVAAIKYAGPSIMLSFVISGLACAFAALCYAEFASLIPVAGSAYTYAYATLGELVAWIIGWDLILEYAVSASAVAIGWSNYFNNLLLKMGIDLPDWMVFIRDAQHPNGLMNVFAAVIVLLITVLLTVGVKESANVNGIVVVIKVSIALFFIGLGIFFVKTANWHPFIPPHMPSQEIAGNIYEWPLMKVLVEMLGGKYPEGFGGLSGMMTAAAIIFFAYIGFDAVSTTAEEAKNPQRDLPIGIIASLSICTVLYMAVSAVFTGIVHCDGNLKLSDLGSLSGAPLAYALNVIHQEWASVLLSIGAICGITSVLLVLLLGQPRIFFSMARDRLLPRIFSAIHPRFKTPHLTTIATGCLVAVAAAFTPIEIVAEMANIGTLFAFVLVCFGVLFLRKKHSSKGGGFLAPAFPLTPILGILFSLALMVSLPVRTWLRFVVWLALGLIIYFFYGYWRSELRENNQESGTVS